MRVIWDRDPDAYSQKYDTSIITSVGSNNSSAYFFDRVTTSLKIDPKKEY